MDVNQVTRAGYNSAGIIEQSKKGGGKNGLGAGKVFAVILACLVLSVALAGVQYAPGELAKGKLAHEKSKNVEDEEASYSETIAEYDGDNTSSEDLGAIVKQDEDEDIIFDENAAELDENGNERQSVSVDGSGGLASEIRIILTMSGARKDNINVGDTITIKANVSGLNVQDGSWDLSDTSCASVVSSKYFADKKVGQAKYRIKKACTFSVSFSANSDLGTAGTVTRKKVIYLKSYPVISNDMQVRVREVVKEYAWPSFSGKTERKQGYNDALKGNYKGGCDGNDCSAFVGLVMRKSGVDNGFPGTTTSKVYEYLLNSSQWMDVTDRIRSNDDARPGDIIITRGKGHALVYTGKMTGFDSVMASAVYDSNCNKSRAPMADKQQYIMWYKQAANNGNEYAIFRHK